MKVIVLVKATEESEAGHMPDESLLTKMGEYNQALHAAGILISGDGLHPSARGRRVTFNRSHPSVTDGPFPETTSLVSGYWIWEVSSLDEASMWAKRCPFTSGQLELRPAFEPDDFGEEFTDELREQEAELGRSLARPQTHVQPYLFFGGRCEEALDFYRRALAAEIVMQMRYSESPDPLPQGFIPTGFEEKIMHATMRLGKVTILASDGCETAATFAGFRLALSTESATQCDEWFAALSEEGTVDMPLTKTFWSPRYGMVTDRFGVGWKVMVTSDD